MTMAAAIPAAALRFDQAYHDQGDEGYDDADEGGPLPKLTDDPSDLAPFIPADRAAVLSALRLTGTPWWMPCTSCSARCALRLTAVTGG